MDGVGARLGRSSNRYAPTTTVFTGPVRRWKKKWIHGTPPSSGNNNRPTANGGVNGSNGSHLLLFKWTPITSSQNSNGATNSSAKDDGFIDEQPPKRKFKYIPINVLEEQKNDASEQAEDDIKAIESDTNSEEPTSQADGYDEKPDINDMPMEEIQAPQKKPPQRQDLNERTLDLSLG
ncbi:uncharacterized protein LOC107788740 [Nicotiana tabacum]|uniref:Uncharacterized protein LOC107788740 n=1 Tax=Nicotiana tabacum TaxID=4097 RepID=A0A1S3ZNH7_TOBAC|nr:PREDICTED: uncharacterized protein LOC107788740 [Nicotiana tabacum]